jgi:hypothetical protein
MKLAPSGEGRGILRAPIEITAVRDTKKDQLFGCALKDFKNRVACTVRRYNSACEELHKEKNKMMREET